MSNHAKLIMEGVLWLLRTNAILSVYAGTMWFLLQVFELPNTPWTWFGGGLLGMFSMCALITEKHDPKEIQR